ncbi:hypothetical protein FQZ97_1095460 [compost metagenome]
MLHADGGEPGRVVTRLAGLDRRHVHHQRAGAQPLGGALAEQHVFDHLAVFEQGDHQVGLRHRLCRGVADLGAKGSQALGLVG